MNNVQSSPLKLSRLSFYGKMCILCVVQRWSRRIATMLPWLVIPLVSLWFLSQFLPPNFQFEVTSPRIACVSVLAVTLLWYEFLMPQISVWRARRSARIREERKNQALELQKLKKCAMRRCRNCLTPYREQNPCGGKFMCSYCGHASKRPVLDIPGWNDCASGYWLMQGGPNGGMQCLAEKSYSGVLVLFIRAISSTFFQIWWVFSKLLKLGSRDEDSIGDNIGDSKKGDNGVGFQESRAEKARRKAEERRQARIEREMLEEEERKQREEVARLVEEQRKLREEKLEAEKVYSKVNASSNSKGDGERESRREAEKRKKERRRERDKASSHSSKSNSDGEEMEKRISRESEKKKEFDKKSELERQKALVESLKAQVLEANNKAASGKPRYFDRVKGNFFSNARNLNGTTSFFGRNTQPSNNASKISKSNAGVVNHAQKSGPAKIDARYADNVTEKSAPSKDNHSIVTNAPKKSWHQLFRSSSVSPDPDSTNFANEKMNTEAKGDHPIYYLDNQQKFGNMTSSSSIIDSMLPSEKEPTHSAVVEDELFEDPCYVPDPLYQLDTFPLDLGTGFIENSKVEAPHVHKNVDVSKPSPIESPLARLKVFEERHMSCTPKSMKNFTESSQKIDVEDSGTWHMWGSPLARGGIDLAGGPASWFPSPVQKNCISENILYPRLPCIVTPQKASSPTGNGHWAQNNSPFQSPSQVDGGIHLLPPNFLDNPIENELMYSTPRSSASMNHFEVPLASGWSKEEWPSHHGTNGTVKSNPHPPVENLGLFSTGPDVQSVWSYNHQ